MIGDTFNNLFEDIFNQSAKGNDPYLTMHDREQALEAAKKFCGDDERTQRYFAGSFLWHRRTRNIANAEARQ